MPTGDDHPKCLGPPRVIPGRELFGGDTTLLVEADDGNDSYEIEGHLEIELSLEPDPRLVWHFHVSDGVSTGAWSSLEPDNHVWATPGADRRIPLLAVTCSEKFGAEGPRTELSGIVDSQAESAATSEAVETIRFDVVNFDAPYGTLVVTDDSGTRAARHEWEFAGWRVILDGQPGVDWRQMSARAEFGVTHVGSLMRTDGSSFDFEDGYALLECVHWFLSFVQGRRVGIALPSGYAKAGDVDGGSAPVVERWSIFVTDAAGSGVRGWYPALDRSSGPPHLGALAEAFHSSWSTSVDEQQRIRFLISILCTATAQTILVEPRLVMAFVGLEALVGETLSASQTVNMNTHLKQALQQSAIPTNMSYLQNPRIPEPVRHVVAVRNAIVHSNTQLSDSTWGPSDHVVHAWQVAHWMLQRMLLKRFGYGGYCYNHMNFEIESFSASP